jgi:hypothetical protein
MLFSNATRTPPRGEQREGERERERERERESRLVCDANKKAMYSIHTSQFLQDATEYLHVLKLRLHLSPLGPEIEKGLNRIIVSLAAAALFVRCRKGMVAWWLHVLY